MQHHAYIYEGSLKELPVLASDARARFGFEAGNHPDVHVREFEKFGIDESRWLTEAGALRSAGGRALFVVGVSVISREAQQALLKLFEEPQAGTTFVLLAPHGALIPTLRSRMLVYESQKLTDQKSSGLPSRGARPQSGQTFAQQASAFLKSSQKERSDYITKMLKDDEGAKERARDFVNALEVELYRLNLSKSEVRRALDDLAAVRDYLGDRAPSLKMLLEHLALALPTL